MPVNSNKPERWKADIARSVDMYNAWFLSCAPDTFRAERTKATQAVEAALKATRNFVDITPALLKAHPSVLPVLRMSACPPIAVDRLIGLSGADGHLVRMMEEGKLPSRLQAPALDAELDKIGRVINRMADPDIFVWRGRAEPPSEQEVHRAAIVVADRLCGSVANPIIRNAQEKRQLDYIRGWLEQRGYRFIPAGSNARFTPLAAGTFVFRLNIPVRREGTAKDVNIPVDTAVCRKARSTASFPC